MRVPSAKVWNLVGRQTRFASPAHDVSRECWHARLRGGKEVRQLFEMFVNEPATLLVNSFEMDMRLPQRLW